MHEIITLQLGSQANYIGTHFWNTQESYFTYGSDQQESPVDHDVHFRPGKAADGSDTYTPRTIVYDFKQNFGTLRALNELYNKVEVDGGDYAAQSLWGGSTSQQRNAPVEVSDYQQSLAAGLEPAPMSSGNVRFWSDYNRVFLNPKSVVQIYETELNPGQTAFEDWTAGEELFKSLDRDEDVFDQNVRAFVEESDQLQGLQLFTSSDDGWSGFSAQFMERIRDELVKLPVWVWASSRSTRGVPGMTAARRATTQARSLVELAQAASIYVPLTSSPSHLPSYVSVESDSQWSTAALQLAALETASLPSRLRRSPTASTTLDEMTESLKRPGERSIVELACEALPDSGTAHQSNGNTSEAHSSAARDTFDSRASYDLFPYEHQRGAQASDREVFAEVRCSRGQAFATAKEANDGSDITSSQLRSEPKVSRPATARSVKSQANMRRSRQIRLDNVALGTKLQSSDRTSAWSKALASQTQRFFDPDEREEMVNSLNEIADSYRAGYGSDEEWD